MTATLTAPTQPTDVEVTSWACAHPGCEALLRPVPCGDEFAYVDDSGASFVRHGIPEKLDAVEARIAEYQARRATVPTVLWHVRQQLTHQMTFGGWGHLHRPDRARRVGPLVEIEVPEHCAWPMRLTPTGWACRQCPERVAADGLAILTRS